MMMEEEDNTKENEGAEEGGGFVDSFAAFDKVSKLLACTECGTIPVGNDKIFTFGNCFHKYCSTCVDPASEQSQFCGACKLGSKSGKPVEDTFSSSVLVGLTQLKAEVMKMKQCPKMKKDDISKRFVDGNPESGAAPLTENMVVDVDLVVPIPAKRSTRSRSTVTISSTATVTATTAPAKKCKSNVESPVVDKPIPAKRSKSRCLLSPDMLDLDEDVGHDPVASTPIAATRGRPKFTPSTIESVESNQSPSTPTPTTEIIDRPRNRSGRRSNNGSIGSGESKSTPTPERPKSRNSRNRSNGSSIGSDSPGGAGNSSFSSNSGKLDKKNAKGESLLHVAARLGQLDKAQQLVLHGADTNVQDYAGWTPLHEAINGKGDPECKLDLVKLLCEQGTCNPNIVGMDNESALHEAARAGLKDIIVYLLKHDASPNIRNGTGKLPRDVAATEEIQKCFDDASDNQDAIEDPVVLELQLSNAVVHFSYDISAEDLSKVENILKLKVSKELGDKVTHIIFCEVPGSERVVPFSYEYLHGIANGCWMLSSEWIDASITANRVFSPSGFEINGCDEMEDTAANVPRSSRLNRELGNPGLFHGFCFYFYKNSSYEKIGKKKLISLSKLAAAEVIIREPQPNVVDPLEYPIRFHLKQGENHKLVLTSHVILYDDKNRPPTAKMHNMEHMKVLKTRWLIDSLVNYQLKDPESYL